MPIDRAELRGWLEANCPAEMREPGGEDDTCWGGRRWVFQSEAQKLWLTRCVGRGFTVPTWPKEYGGAGYSREDAAILIEEMRRIHARPPLVSFGIWMLGPALWSSVRPSRKRRICPASRAARFAGARVIPNRAPALISPRSALGRRTRAITSSSTARRSGHPTPTRRTGSSASCAPTPAPEAEGHILPAHRHGEPRRIDPANRSDLRQVAVLRDILRQCRGSARESGWDAAPGLGRRQVPPDA